ncbi:MAG TPA: DUF5681 domain-containing protein [Xanthobacteraceae bacterium]
MSDQGENSAANQRRRGRPFAPGVSGNPAGKPRGTRNRTTLAVEALLDGEAEKLARKAVEVALTGDVTALRLCLDRIAPDRRGRPVYLTLPQITDAATVLEAHAVVLAELASGQLTPDEGEALGRLLQSYLKAVETVELDARIAALENRAGIR